MLLWTAYHLTLVTMSIVLMFVREAYRGRSALWNFLTVVQVIAGLAVGLTLFYHIALQSAMGNSGNPVSDEIQLLGRILFWLVLGASLAHLSRSK